MPALKALISTEGLPAVRLHSQGDDFLKETHFLRRGDPNQKEAVAPAGFLQLLTAHGTYQFQGDWLERWGNIITAAVLLKTVQSVLTKSAGRNGSGTP